MAARRPARCRAGSGAGNHPLPFPPVTFNCCSGIPPAWAANGSFTRLRAASLAGNPLGGALPPAWGGSPGALPSLQSLDLSDLKLTGPLPPQWGPGLQSLQEL